MRIYHSHQHIEFHRLLVSKKLLLEYVPSSSGDVGISLRSKKLNLVRVFNGVGVMSIFHKIMYKKSTKQQPTFWRGWLKDLSQWMLIIARDLQSLWSRGEGLMQLRCIVHQIYDENIKGLNYQTSQNTTFNFHTILAIFIF